MFLSIESFIFIGGEEGMQCPHAAVHSLMRFAEIVASRAFKSVKGVKSIGFILGLEDSKALSVFVCFF